MKHCPFRHYNSKKGEYTEYVVYDCDLREMRDCVGENNCPLFKGGIG